LTNKMMKEIQLMTVNQKTIGNVVHPRIFFNGDWLIKLGFKLETLVSAIYENDVLTLKACGTGISTYKQIVSHIRAKKGQLFQVTKDWYSKSSSLVIEGNWLKRQGILVDDLLVVQFLNTCIKIRKIQHTDLNLNDDMNLSCVQLRRFKNNPCFYIYVRGGIDCHFKIGGSAKITYQDNDHIMIFTPVESPCNANTGGKVVSPSQINVVPSNVPHLPLIRAGGKWLAALGYEIGESVIIAYKANQVILKKLDFTQFF
jgi:hypothetical protein